MDFIILCTSTRHPLGARCWCKSGGLMISFITYLYTGDIDTSIHMYDKQILTRIVTKYSLYYKLLIHSQYLMRVSCCWSICCFIHYIVTDEKMIKMNLKMQDNLNPWVFGRSRQLSLNKFLDLSTPSMRKGHDGGEMGNKNGKQKKNGKKRRKDG